MNRQRIKKRIFLLAVLPPVAACTSNPTRQETVPVSCLVGDIVGTSLTSSVLPRNFLIRLRRDMGNWLQTDCSWHGLYLSERRLVPHVNMRP